MKRLALALAVALIAAPAMAVDLTQQITLIGGKPILDPQGKPQPMELGDLIKNTLLITDQAMTKDQKAQRFWLAIKIDDKKEITFTPQELTEIEDALWKYQSILVAGQAVLLLDPTAGPQRGK